MLQFLVHIVLILPILTSSWFYESYELPKVLILFLCSFPIVIWSVVRLAKKTIVVIRNKENPKTLLLPYTFILFLGSLCLASYVNDNVSLALWGQPYRYQGIIFLLCCGALAYFVSYSDSENLRKYTRTIAFMGIISCVVVIAQYLALNVFRFSIPAYAGRPIGTFGNPNFAAGYIALSYAMAWVSWKKLASRISLVLLFCFAIICTGSLSGLAAFIIMWVVLFSSKSKRKFIGMMVIVSIVGLVMYQSYSSRTPSSFDRRSIIWEKAWHAFLQRPFTGWGIENFNTALQANVRPEEIHLTHIRVDKAHNELLEILVAGGFMSFTFYIFLLVFIFIKAYARAIKGKEPAILAMLLGYMVYSVANVQGISQYVLVFFSVGILMASSSHYDST